MRRYRLSGELPGIERRRGKKKIFFFTRAAVEQFQAQLQGESHG